MERNNSQDVLITAKDMRELKYCSSGRRRFFELHGLNHSDFLKNGIKASVLSSVNNGKSDAMVDNLIQYVRNKNNV